MRNNWLPVIIAFLLVVSRSTNSTCPAVCNCTTTTLSCMQCLLALFRQITIDGKCVCMDGFKEQIPPKDYCCPSNCTACYFQGCAKCMTGGWQIWRNPQLQVKVCKCRENYYFNGKDCVCGNPDYPGLFYEDTDNYICLRCPAGCSCNQSGCFDCSGSMRKVVVGANGRAICPCSSPLHYNYNGTCICYGDCDCILNYCFFRYPQIQIVYQTGSYVTQKCKARWVQINGTCKCLEPFQLESQLSCVCKSIFNQSKYYLVYTKAENFEISDKEENQECHVCSKLCTCNNYGCVFCRPEAHRVVGVTSCPCAKPYVEVDSNCICFEPYFINQNGRCVCLSEFNSTLYVFDKITGQCYQCPTGCLCSQLGCVSCNVTSVRQVKQSLNPTFFQCPCIMNAMEENGVCRCNYRSYFIGNACVCYSSAAVYQSSQSECLRCPENCSCDPVLGCWFCNDLTRNVILDSSTNYSSCPCRYEFYEDKKGVCQCAKPYVKWTNQTWSGKILQVQCLCMNHYIIYEGECRCKSVIKPNQFFYNTQKSSCEFCPRDCKCSESGCHSCAPNSLRYSYQADGMQNCECLQMARWTDSTCRICSFGSFYLNGVCVPCPECSDCDSLGCTGCGFYTDLVDHACVCTNNSLININGNCICPIGLYDVTGRGFDPVCQKCPIQCFTCHLNRQTNLVECLACGNNTHRYSPHDGCICQEGYIEISNRRSYCCSLNCQECDELGCTACYPFTNRRLVNNSCICNEGTFETNTTAICGCPDGLYLTNGTCWNCPKNCQTCSFNPKTDTVQCLSCRINVNRGEGKTCKCLDGFEQVRPSIAEYCYPRYCKQMVAACKHCISGRTPDRLGRCICQEGFYENSYTECIACNLTACLACASAKQCLKCEQRYYLVGASCKKNPSQEAYFYLQCPEGIMIELDLRGVTAYSLNSLRVSIQKVGDLSEASNLAVKSIEIGALMIINLHNPVQRFQQVAIQLDYSIKTLNLTNSQNETLENSDQNLIYRSVTIKKSIIYSQQDLKLSQSLEISLYTLMVAFILTSLFLYLKGFKHNQIMFYLQTMSFLGFFIEGIEYLQLCKMLYGLHFSYFSVGHSLINFIPIHYFESSSGNFPILTKDSNTIRVAGTTIAISIVVCLSSCVLRIVNKLNPNSQTMKNIKKPVYRLLEFLYKLCMYPLVFLSIQTIIRWNSARNDNQTFATACNWLSVFCLIAYAAVTICSVVFEQIAKVNKIQNGMEFISVIIASIIFGFSKQWYILSVTTVFIGRGIVYYFARKILLRDFQKVELLKLLGVCLEVMSIGCIYWANWKLTIGLIILTVVLQIGHEICVSYFTQKQATYDRKCSMDATPNQSELDVDDVKRAISQNENDKPRHIHTEQDVYSAIDLLNQVK